MTQKIYDWANGATLDEHSKRKHKILQEYFREYLITRCKLPQQEKFRLAIVDGFAGAGIYKCGSFGSPLLFIQTLDETLKSINVQRAANNMRLIEVECTFIFNDFEGPVIEQLKQNVAPLIISSEENPQLHMCVEYFAKEFGEVYSEIKSKLLNAGYRNVIFNLDQCGHSQVSIDMIRDIMCSWKSVEVFLTFAISALLAFLSPRVAKDKILQSVPEVREKISSLVKAGDNAISKETFLGRAEQIVFGSLKDIAPFVSPFSINNPDGWRYWLIHFANSYRARQVYNNVLHRNSSIQAHFGRSGLKMLSYDPNSEGTLYLFDENSRTAAKADLYDDIPRLIEEHGDVLTVEEFYTASYNETAAHSDDIHAMMIENPDVEVLTPQGRERRKSATIKPSDILKLKRQKTMFPIFAKAGKGT